MFPWFSRLSYWLLVRNLRLSWDRGGSLITLKSNVQCDFDTAHFRVLIEKLNWLQESDEPTTFLIISHSPSMTQPRPWCSLLRRHNDHDIWEAPDARRQACRDRGSDQCLLTSQSPIVKVWLTQANIGSDRLQNTIITYLSTINPQHRTTKSSGRSVTSQWLLTILTGRGQHSWWGSCVKGSVLCSCLQRLVVT